VYIKSSKNFDIERIFIHMQVKLDRSKISMCRERDREKEREKWEVGKRKRE
jgi:hypothetical protein